jgi:hypothetical protein
MKMKWSVYWTETGSGGVIDPPVRDRTYTHEDINKCYKDLAKNIASTHWKGYVDVADKTL